MIDTITMIMLLAAAAVSARNGRGLLWLGAILANYWVSTLYWRSAGGAPELATGLCDAALCLAIFFLGKSIWEMRVWALYMVSLAINFVYLASNLTGVGIIDHEIYSIIEEVLNWLAICNIAFTSALLIEGFSDARALRPWNHIFGLVRPFHREVARNKGPSGKP